MATIVGSAMWMKAAMSLAKASSHDLILGQTLVGIGFHHVAPARSPVLGEAKAQRSTAVLVTLELRDGRLGGVRIIKQHHTSSTGSAAWLVLYLCLLHLSNCGEEFDQIIVTRRPGKLV